MEVGETPMIKDSVAVFGSGGHFRNDYHTVETKRHALPAHLRGNHHVVTISPNRCNPPFYVW